MIIVSANGYIANVYDNSVPEEHIQDLIDSCIKSDKYAPLGKDVDDIEYITSVQEEHCGRRVIKLLKAEKRLRNWFVYSKLHCTTTVILEIIISKFTQLPEEDPCVVYLTSKLNERIFKGMGYGDLLKFVLSLNESGDIMHISRLLSRKS